MPRKGRHHKFTEYNTCPECGGLKTAPAELCMPCRVAKNATTSPVPKTVCPRCKGHKVYRATLCRACTTLLATPTIDRAFPLNGKEAAEYGATVTLENADGERLTVHRAGMPVRRCVRDAYDYATRLDPGYRIVAVSTPTSVYGDLIGAERRNGVSPESAMGLGEMLHPRLRRSTAEATI